MGKKLSNIFHFLSVNVSIFILGSLVIIVKSLDTKSYLKIKIYPHTLQLIKQALLMEIGDVLFTIIGEFLLNAASRD
jgi:hypothetical protein